MKIKVYAVFLFLVAQNILASDNLIVTINFFSRGVGGHVHLSILQVDSKKIIKAYSMNLWESESIYKTTVQHVLHADFWSSKKEAFLFKGDFEQLKQAWRDQYKNKLVRPNYWYNNCADDVLDSLAFVFKVQAKGLRRFWRVARFVLPVANIVPTFPAFAYSEAKKAFKRHKEYTRLSSKEMGGYGL